VPDPVRHGSEYIDHVSQAKPGIKVFPDKLYVVTTLSNPIRFRSRYENYRNFEKDMEESGVILYTVEAAFGGRKFEVTEPNNIRHIQLRTNHEIWYKENLTNIGISRLPDGWNYVAWVDADMHFERPDWAQETLHLLQHYRLIQMWSNILELSDNYEPIKIDHMTSFMYNWLNDITINVKHNQKMLHPYYYYMKQVGKEKLWYGPPGGAWAARRDAFRGMKNGLIDWSIVGGGDSYMVAGLIGGMEYQLRKDLHPEYKRLMMEWQELALAEIRQNIGYMPGTIRHQWHGNKSSRVYGSREKLLADNKFNPITDLTRDHQGLYGLVDHGDPRSINLRDDLRAYFRRRDEDRPYMGG
jgi:hypothetical protein